MSRYSKEKVVYLPGWLDLAELHPEFFGLEIWKKDIDPEKTIKAEYLIGNSLGCHFALLNWRKNRNTKLILINPPLEKRPFLAWMWRWLKFAFFEGWRHFDRKKARNSRNIFQMIQKARAFFQEDYWPIVSSVPAGDLLIVRGGKDDFFCDQKILKKARSKNIAVFEIPEMGHAWEGKYIGKIGQFIH